MGPTRWRKSTHVVVGAAVLAFVAVVVAAAALVRSEERFSRNAETDL